MAFLLLYYFVKSLDPNFNLQIHFLIIDSICSNDLVLDYIRNPFLNRVRLFILQIVEKKEIFMFIFGMALSELKVCI